MFFETLLAEYFSIALQNFIQDVQMYWKSRLKCHNNPFITCYFLFALPIRPAHKISFPSHFEINTKIYNLSKFSCTLEFFLIKSLGFLLFV